MILSLLIALAIPAEKIHIDVGVGPSAMLTPSLFRDTKPWLPGAALEICAVVPGEVARAKAPKSARKFISPNGEIRVDPWWLAWIPREITTAPGDSITVFGARWAFFGLDGGVDFGGGCSLRAGFDLVSVGWQNLSGPAFAKPQNVFNIGTAGKAFVWIQPGQTFAFEAGWVQQLGYPTDAWIGPDRRSLPWTTGTARALLHVRIPMDVKI